jgi:hypothetical protein
LIGGEDAPVDTAEQIERAVTIFCCCLAVLFFLHYFTQKSFVEQSVGVVVVCQQNA